jgi:hypothetical protein
MHPRLCGLAFLAVVFGTSGFTIAIRLPPLSTRGARTRNRHHGHSVSSDVLCSVALPNTRPRHRVRTNSTGPGTHSGKALNE